jgi:hypothetical protein
MPNHDVALGFESRPCEVPWYIELPLVPTLTENTTAIGTGILGAALNGVPLWSAGGENGNSVLNDDVSTKQKYSNYWTGSSGSSGTTGSCQWRYAAIGANNNATDFSAGLVGYALDGFPIYQSMSDESAASRLDTCNFDSGSQQYHIRKRSQVNESHTCDQALAEDDTPWKYILGCYVGDVNSSKIESCAGKTVTEAFGPYDGCVLEARSDDWEDNFCEVEVAEDCKPKWYERSTLKLTVLFLLVVILLGCLGVEMYKLYNRHALR